MLQDTTAQMQKIIDIVVKERNSAQANAVSLTQSVRGLADERDAIQREVERSHRALNESVQRERDAVKRAEAAEAMREVYCNDRDDLLARLAKLLAACEAFRTEEFATDNGWTLFVQAIAEARSGATDAPQAKENAT
jgi:chromosome segregation ATPase